MAVDNIHPTNEISPRTNTTKDIDRTWRSSIQWSVHICTFTYYLKPSWLLEIKLSSGPNEKKGDIFVAATLFMFPFLWWCCAPIGRECWAKGGINGVPVVGANKHGVRKRKVVRGMTSRSAQIQFAGRRTCLSNEDRTIRRKKTTTP